MGSEMFALGRRRRAGSARWRAANRRGPWVAHTVERLVYNGPKHSGRSDKLCTPMRALVAGNPQYAQET